MSKKYMETIFSQQTAAVRGAIIFDLNGKVIRSSLNAPVPRNLLKSLLASFRVPRSQVKTQIFQCYYEGDNYRCLTVNPNVIVGWAKSSRFALNKCNAGIVMFFEEPNSPISSLTASEDYVKHLKIFQSVQEELISHH